MPNDPAIIALLKEAQFWTGVFTLIGTLGGAIVSFGAILLKELISNRGQVNLERLRLYEKDRLEAYKGLYCFISNLGDSLYPPEDPRGDFIDYMSGSFVKKIKPNKLMYSAQIRSALRELETQYECLINEDLIPPMKFDDFIDKKAGKLLENTLRIIEKETDRIIHRKP